MPEGQLGDGGFRNQGDLLQYLLPGLDIQRSQPLTLAHRRFHIFQKLCFLGHHCLLPLVDEDRIQPRGNGGYKIRRSQFYGDLRFILLGGDEGIACKAVV